jgi:hypothetical protein
MVDPKETNERTVEIEAGLGQAARKVWMKPRLESLDIAVDTTATSAGPPHTDGHNSVS